MNHLRYLLTVSFELKVIAYIDALCEKFTIKAKTINYINDFSKRKWSIITARQLNILLRHKNSCLEQIIYYYKHRRDLTLKGW